VNPVALPPAVQAMTLPSAPSTCARVRDFTKPRAVSTRLLAAAKVAQWQLCVLKTSSDLILRQNRLTSAAMVALLLLLLNLFGLPFKSKSRLVAENAALRQQVIVLQRKVRGRIELTNSDRLFFIQLYRWFPSILNAITIIQPETLVRWHRAGFRRYWRWKSRNLGGRPRIDAALRALIRKVSMENVLWGAPRIRGELLKLGFTVAQSTVARYMARTDGSNPPGQRWGTFVHNHMPQIAAMDLFVVPTLGFNLLYVLVIVRLARRELVWINVTSHPTAEWIAQQITEAFPWGGDEVPRYLIRDRDALYGAPVSRRLRAMGIRDKPIAPVRLGKIVTRRD
jgi:hypothetical protein